MNVDRCIDIYSVSAYVYEYIKLASLLQEAYLSFTIFVTV